MAHVPTANGKAWYSGATFERNNASTVASAQAHAHNQHRLSQLLPQAAQALHAQWNSDSELHAWVGVRCASVNRLPKVGPLDAQRLAGLHILSALGSRGLTTALLCAQWLADHIVGKPPAESEALYKAMQCDLENA